MKTEAWGWLAAGVLALGLNGVYHDGGAVWLHRNVDRVIARVADRSGAMLALATGRADWFMAKAHLAAARNEPVACPVQTALARVETRMAHARGGIQEFEEMSARQEAALARLEADRARMEAQLARLRFSPVAMSEPKIAVICPWVRVEIPRVNIPMVRVSAPVVRVGELGSGPI
jgi:hypothetical protein